jgi:hypothetical protein
MLVNDPTIKDAAPRRVKDRRGENRRSNRRPIQAAARCAAMI